MRRGALAALASALAIVVASALLAAGIVLYRPLPTIDGHVRFLGLRERAEVWRDGFGVPYIVARNSYDLYFLQGYVTAQDRLFQMDLFRRIARSDSERVLGLPGRAMDKAVRELGILDRARADFARSDPTTREMASAYAAGVNKYIEQHADGALPVEFLIVGYRVTPWSDIDPVAIFHALAIALGSSESPAAEVLRSWFVPPSAPPAACWAVPGPRTLTGAPLLAGEMPATGWVPVFWHEIGLERPGVRLMGFAIPGVPSILSGRNERVAWSLARTNVVIGVRVVLVAEPGRAEFQPSPSGSAGPRSVVDLPKLGALHAVAAAGNVQGLAATVSDLGVIGLGACLADEREVAWTSTTRPTGSDGAVGHDESGRGIAIVGGTSVDLGRARPDRPERARVLAEALQRAEILEVERSRAILNAMGASNRGPVTFEHPLTRRYDVAVLGIGPVESRYGAVGQPAVRFIADLSDPDRSWSILPTGQSAHLVSPHRADQTTLWAAGRLKPMALRRDHIAIVEGALVLRAR